MLEYGNNTYICIGEFAHFFWGFGQISLWTTLRVLFTFGSDAYACGVDCDSVDMTHISFITDVVNIKLISTSERQSRRQPEHVRFHVPGYTFDGRSGRQTARVPHTYWSTRERALQSGNARSHVRSPISRLPLYAFNMRTESKVNVCRR